MRAAMRVDLWVVRWVCGKAHRSVCSMVACWAVDWVAKMVERSVDDLACWLVASKDDWMVVWRNVARAASLAG